MQIKKTQKISLDRDIKQTLRQNKDYYFIGIFYAGFDQAKLKHGKQVGI
jgi:hypothetical protein